MRKEEVRALREQGLSQRQIAETLGVSRRTVRGYLDGAVQEAMASIGTSLVPRTIWFKNKNYSIQVRPEEVSFLEQVLEAFKDIPAAPPVSPPPMMQIGEMNIIPLFDVHLGLLAHKEISGEDYDLEIAADRVRQGVADLLNRFKPAERGIVINGGDFTHQTDDLNRTRRSNHVLDVASRNLLTVRKAIEVISHVIEMTLGTHQTVEYYSVPGNHDPQNWETILLALAERYRNEPRVLIDTTFREFSVIEHQKVALFVHHGDKRLPKDLAMFCAAEYPVIWGRTEYRLVLTGHQHHLKADEFPGIYWMQLPPVTVRDHYAASSGYASKAALIGLTFDKQGEISRHRIPL